VKNKFKKVLTRNCKSEILNPGNKRKQKKGEWETVKRIRTKKIKQRRK